MKASALFLLLPLATQARAGASAPDVVQAALTQAVAIPGARAEVTSYSAHVPSGCRVENADPGTTLESSARLTVKLQGQGRDGKPCAGWATLAVRLMGPVPVVTKSVRAGEVLDGAVALQERELRGVRPPEVPTGAQAARALTPGQVLETTAFRIPGQSPGDPVKVRVVLGGLAIEQSGRLVGCTAGRTCAVLPSGKHVEGAFQDGQLLVVLR